MWEPALLCLNSYREWYCLQYMVLQIPQINTLSTSPHHPHHVPTSLSILVLFIPCRRHAEGIYAMLMAFVWIYVLIVTHFT